MLTHAAEPLRRHAEILLPRGLAAQRLAPLVGVLLVAGSNTALAQCVTKKMVRNFAYVAKGGVG